MPPPLSRCISMLSEEGDEPRLSRSSSSMSIQSNSSVVSLLTTNDLIIDRSRRAVGEFDAFEIITHSGQAVDFVHVLASETRNRYIKFQECLKWDLNHSADQLPEFPLAGRMRRAALLRIVCMHYAHEYANRRTTKSALGIATWRECTFRSKPRKRLLRFIFSCSASKLLTLFRAMSIAVHCATVQREQTGRTRVSLASSTLLYHKDGNPPTSDVDIMLEAARTAIISLNLNSCRDTMGEFDRLKGRPLLNISDFIGGIESCALFSTSTSMYAWRDFIKFPVPAFFDPTQFNADHAFDDAFPFAAGDGVVSDKQRKAATFPESKLASRGWVTQHAQLMNPLSGVRFVPRIGHLQMWPVSAPHEVRIFSRSGRAFVDFSSGFDTVVSVDESVKQLSIRLTHIFEDTFYVDLELDLGSLKLDQLCVSDLSIAKDLSGVRRIVTEILPPELGTPCSSCRYIAFRSESGFAPRTETIRSYFPKAHAVGWLNSVHYRNRTPVVLHSNAELCGWDNMSACPSLPIDQDPLTLDSCEFTAIVEPKTTIRGWSVYRRMGHALFLFDDVILVLRKHPHSARKRAFDTASVKRAIELVTGLIPSTDAHALYSASDCLHDTHIEVMVDDPIPPPPLPALSRTDGKRHRTDYDIFDISAEF